jgi:CHAP domain/Putative peptidoglycan binding domain
MQYPGRLVKAGETDASLVRALKVQLNRALGFAPRSAQRLNERDGTFGPALTQAVKLFQARHVDDEGRPLVQDGRVGAITWAALFGSDSVPVVVAAADRYLARVVRVAQHEVAREVREVPANSNRGPRVEDYQRRAGSRPGLAWCCSFVYWCFDEAADALARENPMVRTAGCLDHWQRAAGNGASRISRARAIANPGVLSPGMIFVMDHGGGLGHTGIIASVSGALLTTIEGNTDASRTREGGGVYQLTRKVNEINLGFLDYRNA